MKTILIQVSEEDYNDLVDHVARGDGMGRPLVAVCGLIQDVPAHDVHADIAAEKRQRVYQTLRPRNDRRAGA